MSFQPNGRTQQFRQAALKILAQDCAPEQARAQLEELASAHFPGLEPRLTIYWTDEVAKRWMQVQHKTEIGSTCFNVRPEPKLSRPRR